MSLTPPLPPSGRDFLAFQRIILDDASTRQVAAELKISQTRVRQVARRVLHWLEETLPQDTELTMAARLRLGQHELALW